MSKHVPGLLLGVVLLAACATPQRAPENNPLFESITILPFTIEPHQAEGGEVRPVPSGLLQALAKEATASAADALVRDRISSKVELAPPEAANLSGYRIAGFVRFPAFLPRDEEVHREMGRLEPFVKASVTLLGPNGKAMRTVESLLTWEDLHGPDGAPIPLDRPFEDVLHGAVRQAVEDAVNHLGHAIGDEPGGSS